MHAHVVEGLWYKRLKYNILNALTTTTMNIFDTRISYYRNVTDNTGTEIALRDFLFCDSYRAQIEELRATADPVLRKTMKRLLPLATISGTFSPTRRMQNLVAHSGLICIDIDRQDNADVEWFGSLRDEWHNIPQILFAAHSVGGEGWFAIFRIAHPEQHQAHFEALRQDFLHEGITVDRCCGDVGRMRIISYDPDPYVNENASIYNKVWVRPRPAYQPQPCTDDVMARVESCCHEIVQKGVDVTATYDDWFHAGAALASLGERGRGLFHLISAQNGRYDALETDRKFTDCLMHVNGITIGTFFYICSMYGIDGRGK